MQYLLIKGWINHFLMKYTWFHRKYQPAKGWGPGDGGEVFPLNESSQVYKREWLIHQIKSKPLRNQSLYWHGWQWLLLQGSHHSWVLRAWVRLLLILPQQIVPLLTYEKPGNYPWLLPSSSPRYVHNTDKTFNKYWQ